jgi:hypothetical protein
MKKSLILLLACIVIGFSLSVQAANVTFNPREVVLKVAPGETGRTAIKVNGFSRSAYSLNFLVGSKLENGNIPRGWLTAAYLWLDSNKEGASSATMDLVVSVPADAKTGRYSGLLMPDDMRSSESIISPGVTLSIEVSDH